MRSRLLMLVALPLLVTLASVVWLERVLEKQLIGESMKQVTEARTVLQLELDEHARTLQIELLGLAQSADVSQALENGDSEQVQLAIRDFAASHPEIDIILANSAGKILGTSRPVRLSNLNQLARFSHNGDRRRLASPSDDSASGRTSRLSEKWAIEPYKPARVRVISTKTGVSGGQSIHRSVARSSHVDVRGMSGRRRAMSAPRAARRCGSERAPARRRAASGTRC